MHCRWTDDIQLLLVQTIHRDLEEVVASSIKALEDKTVIEHPGFLVEAAGVKRSHFPLVPDLGTNDSSHGDYYLVVDDEDDRVFENSVDQLAPRGVLRHMRHDQVQGKRVQHLLMLGKTKFGQFNLKKLDQSELLQHVGKQFLDLLPDEVEVLVRHDRACEGIVPPLPFLQISLP